MSDAPDRYTHRASDRPQQSGGGTLEERTDRGEDWFRAFFELASVGMVECDIETGRYLRVNDAFCRMTGYSAAELLGMTFIDTTHPEDREPNWVGFREALRVGAPYYRVEKQYVRKDGSAVWARVNVGIMRDEEGRPVRTATVAEDITERRRAEEALRESEERLRLVVESASDYAIFTLDTEGNIRSWNSGAEGVFGYAAEEVIGRHTEILFAPEDRGRGVVEDEMRRAREVGRAEDERWHTSKRGVRFYVSGVLAPLRRADGVLTGYVKIARDLTERQELEEALARAREEQEERVRERTLELTEAYVTLEAEVRERRAAEERVRQLLRQLVSAQEEERRRVARELHDTLGQQLTALHLSIEMIKSESEGRDRLREHIARTQSIFDQLNADVDFLAWELRPAALDMLGLDAALGNFVHEWSKQFGVDARYQCFGMGGRRLSPESETNLYRILQEALQNVHKHAEATHVSVILEQRDGRVVLIVEDDGCGFDPAAEEAAGKNKGMGVTNMRERTALLGGELEIESAPGAGTTIFVRLPLGATYGWGGAA